MPRIIRTSCSPVPVDGVLVSSAYLRNDIAATALLREARRRASDMLREATEEALDIRQRAHDEGYMAGFALLAEAVAAHLDHHNQLAARTWSRLEAEMRTLLQACTEDAELIMAALEQALARRISPANAHLGVELWLPESWHSKHGEWQARLAARYPWKVRIGHWDKPRIVARHAEHVLEFSPAEFVANALAGRGHLAQELAAGSADLAMQCRRQMLALFDVTHQSDASTLMVSGEITR